MVSKETIIKWMMEDGGAILQDPRNPSILTGYVTFTPERAASALENNVHNRAMGTNRQVPVLKEVLVGGQWDSNVSKINFEESGVLSDGQNRLYAGMTANVAFRCLVTWGVSREAQLVTDRRGNRKLSDDIAIDGLKDARNVATMARIFYVREEQGTSIQEMLWKSDAMSKVSDIGLYNYFNAHKEEILRARRVADRVRGKVGYLRINTAVLNTLSYEFGKVSEQDADVFWERLGDGVSSIEGDPVLALHKRLLDNAKTRVHKITKGAQAALIIKAWNSFMKGETVSIISYRPGGAHPEPFPSIYNPAKE